MYGEGISFEGELISIGTSDPFNVIDKSGAWLSYGDVRWQGKENAKAYLKENPKVALEIKQKIRDIHAEMIGKSSKDAEIPVDEDQLEE